MFVLGIFYVHLSILQTKPPTLVLLAATFVDYNKTTEDLGVDVLSTDWMILGADKSVPHWLQTLPPSLSSLVNKYSIECQSSVTIQTSSTKLKFSQVTTQGRECRS